MSCLYPFDSVAAGGAKSGFGNIKREIPTAELRFLAGTHRGCISLPTP